MRTEDTAGAGPVFFLSYAHTPKVNDHDQADPDSYVVKFYWDICRSLVQISDLPLGDGIGFMDRELRPGDKWPPRLAVALATCGVFVPLYSPRYFSSEHCGREWSAFSGRVSDVAARRGELIEAVIPVLWVPVRPDRLPEAAPPIQYWAADYGSRYATHGLYRLMTLSRYRDEYEETVHELAYRILDVAEKCLVEPGSPADYDALPNAFR